MLPSQDLSAVDPGPASSPSGEEICRKYIWGTCNKYGQCRFRHELDIEKMKDILRFCHDYQNKNGCTRENCKFLHATKEEQNLFLATGKLPRVLAERHAAMASNASNTNSNAETIPEIAMFISESYMSQPPPGPWPPLPPALGGQAAGAPGPPPSASPLRHAALQPGPPPQQPPPQPAPTPAAAQFRHAPASYSTMPSPAPPALFAVNQPAPVVPLEFDASRPPPPIPSHLQPANPGQLKRKVDANGNAGTSKQRRADGSEASETNCDDCMQREQRIDGYKHQMEGLHNEEEAQILLYKKKFQEYEIGRALLKKLVGPELFQVFDNLIEQGAQTPQVENPGSSFISGSQNVSKQDLLQLFQVLLGGGSRNEQNSLFEPVPSTSRVEGTLHSLTSITRRHNVASYTNLGPDLVKFVAETLKNNTPSERPPAEERASEQPNHTNGFAANGQKQATGSSEPARYGYPAAGTVGGMASYPVAGPSGYSAPYPMFHPAVPPPRNRPPHYYPQPPGVPNMPYSEQRAAGPGPSQGMMPPGPSSGPRPGPSNAPPYNYMGRYPQPPFYPPY